MGLLYLTHLALFKALLEFASEQNKIQTAQRRSDAPLNPHYPKNWLKPVGHYRKASFNSKMEQNKLTYGVEFEYIRKLLKKSLFLGEAFSALETLALKNSKNL